MTFTEIDGTCSSRRLNALSVTTRRRTGDVAVTVAVRGRSTTRAISPMKSPAPSSRIVCPPRVTATVPAATTMNSRPRSPSRFPRQHWQQATAKPDQRRPLREVELVRELGNLLELGLGAPGEQRHVPQELGLRVLVEHRPILRV